MNMFSIIKLELFFRFDVAGAGASLKRYSDPSFFKTEHASTMIESDVIMEKKPRRIKVSKKGSTIAKVLLKEEELLWILYFFAYLMKFWTEKPYKTSCCLLF